MYHNLENLSDSQINEMTVRQINALFRRHDDSHLWPICGRFNATDRAVRRLQRCRRAGLDLSSGLAYYLALEREISEIVNNC